MVIRARLFYRAACDLCGREYDGCDLDWLDTPRAADDGWQMGQGADGGRWHRCPDHWILTCSRCGARSEAADRNWLEDAGWDPYMPACPACHTARGRMQTGRKGADHETTDDTTG